jgi:hypothetical protein
MKLLFTYCIHAIILLQIFFSEVVSTSTSNVTFQWTQLDYTWDSEHSYESYLENKQFIPENCLLAGINVDINGDVFVTVPRWRSGVPATLNKIDPSSSTLTPFPSWDMQREGVDGDLQNVQSMTIDNKRRMWVIEVGRRNFFEHSSVPGTPGLWIIDLETKEIITKYYFPEDVISRDESFLNDIVIDQSRDIAFLTDAWGSGAIIVFDLAARLSRRYTGISTQNDPSYAMTVNGVHYGKRIFTTPSDGIALTADNNAIFYCQVQGTTLYRLPTAVLRNFSTTASEIDAAVQNLGFKQPSDGIKYLNGELFWGSLPESRYYRIAVDSISMPDLSTAIASPINEETMEWIDTFAIDLQAEKNHEPSKLWFVSNRLDKYSVNTMDFTGGHGANMRIINFVV